MGFTTEGSGGLGSLAQSARSKQIRSARIILYVIGGLTIALNGFLFSQAEEEVDKALRAEVRKLGPNFVVDPVRFAEAKAKVLRIVHLIYGGAAALGLVFILLGAAIMVHPLAMTVTALVLYIGAAAVFAVLDPSSLVAGIIVKVIIVISLVKAIQAAAAYQKELNAAAAAPSPFGAAPLAGSSFAPPPPFTPPASFDQPEAANPPAAPKNPFDHPGFGK